MIKHFYRLTFIASLIVAATAAAMESFALEPSLRDPSAPWIEYYGQFETDNDNYMHAAAAQNSLEPLVLYDEIVDETDIFIAWTNVNPGSQTEIYRSLSPESGYELIATQDVEDDRFTDN